MEEIEEMEMPCPCSSCGEWFDLTDGYGSKKWYPNTVICKPCFENEKSEIEYDNEEKDLVINIKNGYCIRECKKRLKAMNRPYDKNKEYGI